MNRYQDFCHMFSFRVPRATSRRFGNLLILLLVGMAGSFHACAQSASEVVMPITELMQYQRMKQAGKSPGSPFRKYQLKRIRASKVLADDDPRQIWGYHVHANLEYDKETQPLYRLFRKADFGSWVVIDHVDDHQPITEVVFWGKSYYRRYVTSLRRAGFELRRSNKATNILELRKPDVGVGVDITIWPDIYIFEIKPVAD